MTRTRRIQKIYPLSPMQSGILFHSLKNREANPYFEQVMLTAKGRLDKDLVQESFNLIFERYDILRTIFRVEKMIEPVQIVLIKRNFKLHFEDITHLDENEKNVYLENLKKKDKQRGFDLTKDILMRVALIKTRLDEYHIMWSYHHIIMDGWCIGIFFNELMQIYKFLKEGRPVELEPVVPYRNYIMWLEEQDKEAGLRYWQKYLEGYDRQTSLPKFPKLPKGDEYKGEYHRFIIDEELTSKLNKIVLENQVTMNTLCQTLWGIMLQKYNNTGDAVFGAVVSVRPPEIEGIENMVGLLINTVPVRVKSLEEQQFFQLLRTVGNETISSKAYEYLPLAAIQSDSPLKGNLIDHIMVFENFPLNEQIENRGETQGYDLKVNVVGVTVQINYDFYITIGTDKHLSIRFDYNAFAYENNFIENVALQLKKIASQVGANPGISIKEIEIMTDREKRCLLLDFNRTTADFPEHKTIHQLFREQVEKTPDNTAVVSIESDKFFVTYRQLDEDANRLARYLYNETGISPEDRVGIFMSMSIYIHVCILGILKAGGAYVPLDPALPVKRLIFMINDACIGTVIGEEKYNEQLKRLQQQCETLHSYLCIDKNPKEKKKSGIEKKYKNDLSAQEKNNLVYAIYTSGTSGNPKGVLIEHKSLINYAFWRIREFNMTSSDVTLQLMSPSFDAFGGNLYPAIFSAGKVVMPAKEKMMDFQYIGKAIKNEKITNFSILPSLYRRMLEQVTEQELETLRFVILGGEKAEEDLIRLSKKISPGLILANEYGPTENTIATSAYRGITPGNTAKIGKPVSNHSVFILDGHMALVPVGVPGELYLSGAGLARGYLNRPELTTEKFERAVNGHSSLVISSPKRPSKFTNDQCPMTNDRLYRTGDLGRWLPDGNIEFSGRIDQQVKIRGYRIELEEIKNRLLYHNSIKEAVVTTIIDADGEDKHIYAYYVPVTRETTSLSASVLAEFLAEELPAYMIPSGFIRMERIPLTPGGKVDKKALPKPEIRIDEAYQAPRHELEETLVAMWSGILGIEKDIIGIDSDFFKLGGHSLKAIILASKIHKELNVKIPLVEILEMTTIKKLAGYIEEKRPGDDHYPSISALEKRDFYELSYNQKRLWFTYQLDPQSPAYNMSARIPIYHAVDPEIIKKVLYKIIRRHESFRTRFMLVEGEPVQVVKHCNQVDIPLEFMDISPLEEKEKERKRADIYRQVAVTPFDLTSLPLFMTMLIKLDKEQYDLILNVHHIISDGWSMEILKREFVLLYEGYLEGQSIELEPLAQQYKDFARWQNKQMSYPLFKNNAHRYWRKQLEGGIPPLELPLDFNGDKNDKRSAVYHCVVDKGLKEKLQKLAESNNTTLFTVLFCAYNILLSHFSGQNEIVCFIVNAGREYPFLNDIVGYFVKSIVLKTDVKQGEEYTQLLRRIIGDFHEALRYQQYPIELALGELKMKYPDVSVSFNLLNIDEQNTKREMASLQSHHMPDMGQLHFDTDIELYVSQYKNGIEMNWRYKKSLFKPETIERAAKGYLKLCRYITDEDEEE